ncbi:hypothetical protein NPIL_72991 [Nephila pilipes]|uniref:Uncharacterized protein n=1 Tax=Nephila pilipes TaxID=299642 RepID=A0A8X6NWU4_NEPPI|nr:hypothetical protein NPIL_72991 [Nephila pilipes]
MGSLEKVKSMEQKSLSLMAPTSLIGFRAAIPDDQTFKLFGMSPVGGKAVFISYDDTFSTLSPDIGLSVSSSSRKEFRALRNSVNHQNTVA